MDPNTINELAGRMLTQVSLSDWMVVDASVMSLFSLEEGNEVTPPDQAMSPVEAKTTRKEEPITAVTVKVEGIVKVVVA